MRRLQLLAGCALALAGAHAQSTREDDLEKLVRAGQDILASDSKRNDLSIWRERSWDHAPVYPPALAARLHAFAALDQNRSMVLSSSKSEGCLLTILEGVKPIKTIRFSWPDEEPGKLELAARTGAVWISGESPVVARVSLDEGTATFFDLRPFIFSGDNRTEWNPVKATPNANGTAWIWSRQNDPERLSLLGLFLAWKDGFRKIENIAGLPSANIRDLCPRQGDSLWLLEKDGGLYIFQPDPPRAEPVRSPSGEPFRDPFAILPLKDDWLLLTGRDPSKALWRLSGQDWKLVLGAQEFMSWQGEAPASDEIASGRLIATPSGLLFVPADGSAPRALDSVSGFPLKCPRQVLALEGDRFAALSGGGIEPLWIATDLAASLAFPAPVRFEKIKPWKGWAVDSQDRVYTMLMANPPVVDMWDNGEWREIPIPAELKDRDSLAIDALDRVWVIPSKIDHPVGILEKDRKTWRIAPDYRQALLTFRDGLTNFLELEDYLRPIQHASGKIAMRSRNDTIHLWNGKSWQDWTVAQIIESTKVPDPFVNNPSRFISLPFFDAQGRLCTNTKAADYTWKLEHGQWKTFPREDGIPDRLTAREPAPEPSPIPLPPELSLRVEEPKVVTDNTGCRWVAGNGNLFRFRGNRFAKVFPEPVKHPFKVNRSIDSVRVDRYGNTWITRNYGTEYIFFPAANKPVPDRPVTISSDEWGIVTATGLSDRVDVEIAHEGRSWTVRPGESRELGAFPAGSIEFTARVIDEELNPHELSAVTASVPIIPKRRFEELCAILVEGPPGRREYAVRRLAAHPTEALPALREALEPMPADPWWIQAAIQECERRLQKRQNLPQTR